MFNLISHNVNGLRNFAKRKKSYYYLKEIHKADIVCMQETHYVLEDGNLWQSQWGGRIFNSPGQTNARGTAILIHKRCAVEVLKSICDESGRYIILELGFDGIEIVLASLYAPNCDDVNFYKNFFKQIESFQNCNIIIGGDFNLIMDVNLDRRGTSEYNHSKSHEALLDFMERTNLVDIWRLRNPDQLQYTCHKRDSNQFSRIDLFLISESLIQSVQSASIKLSYNSDHSLITIECGLGGHKRGRGFWKFNARLLEDQEHNTEVEQALDVAKFLYQHENPALKWEMIKMHMVQASVNYSRIKAGKRNRLMKDLQRDLNWLKVQLEIDPNGEQQQIETLIAQKQSQLDELLTLKFRSLVFRSRAKFHSEGERSSKYYFNLEKSRYDKKVIKQIFDSQGNLETDPKNILEVQASFFEKLYAKNHQVFFDIPPSEKKISAEESSQVDKPLSVEELAMAVGSLQNNKTPGPDGLTAEFYKYFWDKLSEPLLEALEYASKIGTLHSSARRGILALIPKKYKDTRYITNQRPITLLNTDYKILAKALTNRINKILEKIISPHQTGFGRNISHNIRKILDITEYAETHQMPGLILSLDFYKCFDSLDHRSIEMALRHFGFGTQFVEKIMLLYNQMETCVQNNGYISRWFKNEQGSPQGSPASTAIFLICGQILSDLIVDNKEIRGLRIEGEDELIIQFADDTNLFLPFDLGVLTAVVHTLDKVYFQLGLKVNYDKTLIYRLGSLKSTNAMLYTTKEIAWTDDPINILGVTVASENEIVSLNYRGMITRSNQILNTWTNRDPTLMGRVLLVNSLIGSLYVYKMMVLPNLPQQHFIQFDKLIRKFLWKGKKPRIALTTLQADKTEGGLRLVNLQKKEISLKVLWVKEILTNGFFSRIFYAQLSNSFEHRIWTCQLKQRDIKKICKSPFWADVLYAWNCYNVKPVKTVKDISEQVIWGNSNIRINGEVVFSNHAYDVGLIAIGDLVIGNKIMSYDELSLKYGNVISWFFHRQIVAAIPVMWKQQIATQGSLIVQRGYTTNFVRIAQARNIYTSLISCSTNVENKFEKWQQEIELDLESEQFLKLFANIYAVTYSTKYRNFQYNLMMRVLVNNCHLYRWKIRSDELCSFCNRERESYKHLFFECSWVRPILNNLEHWFYLLIDDHNHEILLNVQTILFNSVMLKPSHIFNYVILIAKYYIYTCRCANRKPNFVGVKEKIESMYKVEEFIAKKENKWNRHVRKWNIIKPNLQLQQEEDQQFIDLYIAQM